MAITLKRRMQIEDATTAANRWGGIGSQYDKKPFEKDISWGGYSGLPFIKPLVPKDVNQYFSLTTAALSLDFPIRGGSYEEIAARTDFARIDRFVLTYPQGKAFLDKQKGLALSNPKTEVALLANTEITRLFPERPVPLFQQLTSGGTGFRYGNLGESGNDLINQANTYGQTVARKPLIENRLFNLYQTKINVSDGTNFSDVQDIFGTISNIFSPTLVGEVPSQVSTRLGITKTQDSFLMSYQGGPGSRYGIGSTDIYKATDATGAIIVTGRTYPDYKIKVASGPTGISTFTGKEIQVRPRIDLNYFDLMSISNFYLPAKDATEVSNNLLTNLQQQNDSRFVRNNDNTNHLGFESFPNMTTFSNSWGYDQLLQGADPVKYSDFRRNVLGNSTPSSDYGEYNMPKRIGTGDAGVRTQTQRKDINNSLPDTVDKVNFSEIRDFREGETVTSLRDLIKFNFSVINNTDGSHEQVSFRAHLTGYNDQHDAQWDSKRYTGRGENFYTYQGFDRTVTFNFRMAAQTKQEMAPLYRKLNFLYSWLYPDYNSQGFMRGNLARLTIGDLFVNAPGIITSLGFTIQDNYAWEIAMDEPELGSSKDMQEVPQIVDVVVSFKPLSGASSRSLPTKGRNSRIILTGTKFIPGKSNGLQDTPEREKIAAITVPTFGVDIPNTLPQGTPLDLRKQELPITVSKRGLDFQLPQPTTSPFNLNPIVNGTTVPTSGIQTFDTNITGDLSGLNRIPTPPNPKPRTGGGSSYTPPSKSPRPVTTNNIPVGLGPTPTTPTTFDTNIKVPGNTPTEQVNSALEDIGVDKNTVTF